MPHCRRTGGEILRALFQILRNSVTASSDRISVPHSYIREEKCAVETTMEVANDLLATES